MTIEVSEAETYFNDNVVNADEWRNADETKKKRALNNAMNVLTRQYTRAIPDEAVFEQALWILRVDDSVRRAEQGATSISVDGISLSFAQVNRSIAPDVISILGRRIGRSTSGRRGYLVSSNKYVKGLGDWS